MMPRRSWKERFKAWRSSRLLWGVACVSIILLIGFGWMVFDSYRTQAIIRDWEDRGVVIKYAYYPPEWLKSLGSEIESTVRMVIPFRNVKKVHAWSRESSVYGQKSLFTPEDIRNLAKLSKLEVLQITNYSVTDRDLSHIGKLSNISNLRIKCAKVSDTGIQQLSHLKHLYSLSLEGKLEISATGLAELAGWPGLIELDLGPTPITDDEVAKLCQSKSLRKLTLYGSKLSKNGIRQLEQIKSLKDLMIFEPSQPDEFLDEFALRQRDSRRMSIAFIKWGTGVINP